MFPLVLVGLGSLPCRGTNFLKSLPRWTLVLLGFEAYSRGTERQRFSAADPSRVTLGFALRFEIQLLSRLHTPIRIRTVPYTASEKKIEEDWCGFPFCRYGTVLVDFLPWSSSAVFIVFIANFTRFPICILVNHSHGLSTNIFRSIPIRLATLLLTGCSIGFTVTVAVREKV